MDCKGVNSGVSNTGWLDNKPANNCTIESPRPSATAEHFFYGDPSTRQEYKALYTSQFHPTILHTITPHHHQPIPTMSPSRTVAENTGRTVLISEREPRTPYFAPLQTPPAGIVLDDDLQPAKESDVPHIFRPLTLRGVTFHNRIWLPPLCQYSADFGHVTDWHKAHLGGILQSGPGLTIVEATAVQARGRISPQDSGIWLQSQADKWKEVVVFAHSQSQKIGIQLAHAGRKASCVAPFLSMGDTAWEEDGGWPEDVFGPSAIPWNEKYPKPRAMTLDEIEQVKADFVAAAKRAVNAGFDVVEIHNAHGYLLHSFLSPVSNHRTDQYGGSWDNRVRLTLEITEAVRAVLPESMPLLLRISASDNLEKSDEPSWKLEDTIKLAPLLQARGVDLLDISSGGNSANAFYGWGPGHQTDLAAAVKKSLGEGASMRVSAVGNINDGKLAESIVAGGKADVTMVGRGFQKNPRICQMFGQDLGVVVSYPKQIRWGILGRGKGGAKVGADKKKDALIASPELSKKDLNKL